MKTKMKGKMTGGWQRYFCLSLVRNRLDEIWNCETNSLNCCYYYYITPCEFFTPELTDGLSL